MNNGYWSDDAKCVRLYFERDGEYILSMCPLHPEKIYGVEGKACEKCEHRIMDGEGTRERVLI